MTDLDVSSLILGIALIACALIACVAAWRHAARERTIEDMGARHGIPRWNGESLDDYQDRLMARLSGRASKWSRH